MSLVALSELLGASVRDANGAVRGQVREVAVAPQDHATRVAYLIVKTADGERALQTGADQAAAGATRFARSGTLAGDWAQVSTSDGVLLLKRDLLDQQIIDIHGRKVVRVNDVELESTPVNSHLLLNVVSVDVGARGAIRRLSKGVVPAFTLRALLAKIPPRVIPWQFVDLLETDPARRVKLNIEYRGLSAMHPADIADIVEELAPAEREAVFETIDEEVAAEALEEIDPDVRVSIVESLDNDRAADIVGEMDPDAAADLLGELTEKDSDEILQEMQPQERQEVTQLLEFSEHTAAGRMTTYTSPFPGNGGRGRCDRGAEGVRGQRRSRGDDLSHRPRAEARRIGAAGQDRDLVAGHSQLSSLSEPAPRVRARHAAGRSRSLVRQIQSHHARGGR